jgi:hypothetical protein
MNLDNLMVSSILFGFNSGPSMRSRRESKFHFVWSLVNVTWESIGILNEALRQVTHLRLQQRSLDRLPVHLHTDFDFHLLHLSLSPSHRVLGVRSKDRSISVRNGFGLGRLPRPRILHICRGFQLGPVPVEAIDCRKGRSANYPVFAVVVIGRQGEYTRNHLWEENG